jgi:hypothetical protein
MPGWAPIASNDLKASVDGRVIKSDTVPRQTFESVYVPLPPGPQRLVHLDAASVFPLPGDGRMRSFAVKNISFENLTQTDLFARGWHKSGYLFDIDGADTDGWVEQALPALPRHDPSSRRPSSRWSATRASRDYPLAVVDGQRTTRHDQPPMASRRRRRSGAAVGAQGHLGRALRRPELPLGAPDTRSRSYRVVNIDFD